MTHTLSSTLATPNDILGLYLRAALAHSSVCHILRRKSSDTVFILNCNTLNMWCNEKKHPTITLDKCLTFLKQIFLWYKN